MRSQENDYSKLLQGVASVIEALPLQQGIDPILASTFFSKSIMLAIDLLEQSMLSNPLSKLSQAAAASNQVYITIPCCVFTKKIQQLREPAKAITLTALANLTAIARGLETDPEEPSWDLEPDEDERPTPPPVPIPSELQQRIQNSQESIARVTERIIPIWAADPEVSVSISSLIKVIVPSPSLLTGSKMEALSVVHLNCDRIVGLISQAFEVTESTIWLSLLSVLVARCDSGVQVQDAMERGLRKGMEILGNSQSTPLPCIRILVSCG
jgi:hypothetical protein